MSVVLSIGKAVLQGIYEIHKLAKVHPKKVVFLSRQEERPMDFVLLESELKKLDPAIETRIIGKTMRPGLASKIAYGFNVVGPQLHALATSKVAVLDSYSMPVSMLRHRGSKAGKSAAGGDAGLKVIQIWHAMGALKKFSKSIVGKGEGRSEKLADSLKMHANYDLILASSEESRGAFAEAFGYEGEGNKDKFIIGALPRTDLLKNPEYMEKKRVEILERHPELKGKKIVLYAPTLRIDDSSKALEVEKAKELIEAIETASESQDATEKASVDVENMASEYRVVISPHPVKGEHYNALGRTLAEYSTFELLALCDYFVTDYSAVVYEAAVAEKPIFLYAYDLDDYENRRGFYLDFENDMPVPPRFSGEDIAKDIFEVDRDKGSYEKAGPGSENNLREGNKYIEHMKNVRTFAAKYIKDVGVLDNQDNQDDYAYPNTRALAEIIIKQM